MHLPGRYHSPILSHQYDSSSMLGPHMCWLLLFPVSSTRNKICDYQWYFSVHQWYNMPTFVIFYWPQKVQNHTSAITVTHDNKTKITDEWYSKTLNHNSKSTLHVFCLTMCIVKPDQIYIPSLSYNTYLCFLNMIELIKGQTLLTHQAGPSPVLKLYQ